MATIAELPKEEKVLPADDVINSIRRKYNL